MDRHEMLEYLRTVRAPAPTSATDDQLRVAVNKVLAGHAPLIQLKMGDRVRRAAEPHREVGEVVDLDLGCEDGFEYSVRWPGGFLNTYPRAMLHRVVKE